MQTECGVDTMWICCLVLGLDTTTCARSVGLLGLNRKTPELRPGDDMGRAAPKSTRWGHLGTISVKRSLMKSPCGCMGRESPKAAEHAQPCQPRAGTTFSKRQKLCAVKGPSSTQCHTQVAQNVASHVTLGMSEEDSKSQERWAKQGSGSPSMLSAAHYLQSQSRTAHGKNTAHRMAL